MPRNNNTTPVKREDCKIIQDCNVETPPNTTLGGRTSLNVDASPPCACTKPHLGLPFEPQFISPPHKFHYLFFLVEGRQSMCLWLGRLTFPLWGFTFLTFRPKTTAAHFKPFHIWRPGEKRETQSRNKTLRHLGEIVRRELYISLCCITPTCPWTCCSLVCKIKQPIHLHGVSIPGNNRTFERGFKLRL